MLPQKLELNLADSMEIAGALYRASKFSEAEAAFKAIIDADPYNFHAYSALGVALIEQNKGAEALPFIERAGVLVRDELVSLTCNRGRALADIGSSQDALDTFNSILRAYPDHTLSYYNRGLVLLQMGKHEEAIQDMDRVLAVEPENGKARFGRGFARLVLGNYKEGFVDYEYRQKDDRIIPDYDLWDGSQSLMGKRIFVLGEQGLGDNIMFGRYLPMLVQRGAIVYVWVPKSLRSLICSIPGVYWFDPVTSGKIDYWIRFMSLALALGTTVETVPNPMPIKAHKIGTKDRLHIGLCWSGSRTSRYDEYRSIPLKLLKPLFDLDAVFVNLQLDVRESDAETFAELKMVDAASSIRSFEDTANIIANLDLVITVDTSIAHLAGTLGVPTIVMLTAYRTYWLWINNLTSSPWYPSVQLVKQPTDGDWGSVVQQVLNLVCEKLAKQ